MSKVKVFVYGRQRQRRQGYDNSSPDISHGSLKIVDVLKFSKFKGHLSGKTNVVLTVVDIKIYAGLNTISW